jgi:hypothetical protein
MRLRSKITWIVTLAAMAYAASPAGAQPAQGTAQAQGGAQGNVTGGNVTGADAQVGFNRKQQLSPQEQLTQSDVLITRMEGAATAVRRQLEQARQQRDVVKTLCLNDKLSQVDVAVRSARDRKASLAAAVQRNDAELSNHEFTILTVLRQRAEQLTAEANQCIGEEAAFAGETRTTTTIDPTLPSTDETQYPPVDSTLVPPPPPLPASPDQ